MYSKYCRYINYYGKDILKSKKAKKQKEFIQHGTVTVFDHTYNVAVLSLMIADFLKVSVDEKSLVRGALLHDYFLYDWHEKDKSHKMHGFTHAKTALNNAKRDFKINKTEEDMIYSHMFPLNLFRFPKTKEGKILCLADKICAVYETMPVDPLKILVNESLNQSKVHN